MPADGYDPFFVGTKGYPNWQFYTEENRKKLQAFLVEIEKVIENED
jgi:hypothetical protein